MFAFGDAVLLRLDGRPAARGADRRHHLDVQTGLGYWLVALDGGVFAFGDAVFFGNVVGVTEDGAIAITGSAPLVGPGGFGGFYFSVNEGTVTPVSEQERVAAQAAKDYAANR